VGLARGVLRNLRTPDPAHAVVPQRNVPWKKAQWFVLAGLDSATVSTPDGRGVTFRRRDPELFKQMVKQALELHRRAAKQWPDLQARYREAQPWLTSREAWRDEIFEK
jgi:galactofuranosylgalactofuranosylrhamnosyl-N-acetylglucosaminyl-diphospho-decaprenol beta-1,5/1,6-galactofuranosyltransferase